MSRSITQLARQHRFLAIELAGYRALGRLLSTLVPAAAAETPSSAIGKTRTLLVGRGVKLTGGSAYEGSP